VDNVHFNYDRSTSVQHETPLSVIHDFDLQQNYPNPFNPTTTISYYVADESKTVSLKIYNTNGQLVRELLNDRNEIGQHTVDWNGVDESGLKCSSGLYWLKMKVDDRDDGWTRKLMLLK
jgi:flagellar hook assembly protein FlgD